MTGRPAPGLMGFDMWIPHTGLPKEGNIRRNVAYAMEAVGMGMWLSEFVSLDRRTDLSLTPQIYMSSEMGAVRVDDSLVYAIDIDETATP